MGKDTRLEIITMGDELLLGIRENTHLTCLGKHLSRKGLTIQHNLVIRDEEEETERYFRDVWESVDIVITTGGLGPTKNDISRGTIAATLGLELVHDDGVEGAARDRFRRTGRDITDNILRQGKILDGTEVIPNHFGTVERFSADYALSIAGFVGPEGGNRENPRGPIFMGYHSPTGVWSRKIVYPGHRRAVRLRAVAAALDWMPRELKRHHVDDMLASMVS